MSPRRTEGFTLLELLIGVAILALVLAMIYQSYWVCTKSVAAAEEHADLYQAARLALRRLSDDLTCAYAPLPKQEGDEEAAQDKKTAPPADEEGDGDEEAPAEAGASGAAQAAFRATDNGSGPAARDSLTFSSTANLSRGAAAGASDLCQLTYEVQEKGEGQASLVRTQAAGQGQPESVELAPNVKGFDVRFINAEGDEVTEWDSTTDGALPAVVEITLYLGRPEDQEPVAFSTAVQLPLAWEREALGKGLAKLAAEQKAKEKAKEKAQSKDTGKSQETASDQKKQSDSGDEGDEGDTGDEE